MDPENSFCRFFLYSEKSIVAKHRNDIRKTVKQSATARSSSSCNNTSFMQWQKYIGYKFFCYISINNTKEKLPLQLGALMTPLDT